MRRASGAYLFEKPKRRNKSKDEGARKSSIDEALVESIKKDRKKTSDKAQASRAARPERKHSARGNAEFENVGRLNIKGEESTKAWYVGEDSNTMNVSKSEKKHIKAENKKRSIDYLQDVSDFVMESFGKRRK